MILRGERLQRIAGVRVDDHAAVPKLDILFRRHDVAQLDGLARWVAASSEGGTLPVTSALLRGRSASHAIVDYAAEVEAGAIAMTTRARQGLGRVALGSVTMAVVRDASCPVFVVGPLAEA